MGDWTSKAKSARAEPSKCGGRVPDQPVDVDDRTPEPSKDPEMVDVDPAIAFADPDVDSKLGKFDF